MTQALTWQVGVLLCRCQTMLNCRKTQQISRICLAGLEAPFNQQTSLKLQNCSDLIGPAQ